MLKVLSHKKLSAQPHPVITNPQRNLFKQRNERRLGSLPWFDISSWFGHLSRPGPTVIVEKEEPRPPTPESTVEVYERELPHSVNKDWQSIKIRLVGSHPLWGHYLCAHEAPTRPGTQFLFRRWNAARAFASYLDQNQILYRERFVLELGAGGGLPGLVAAKNGAKHVR
jgi:predicted nicotinamide N-methyase